VRVEVKLRELVGTLSLARPIKEVLASLDNALRTASKQAQTYGRVYAASVFTRPTVGSLKKSIVVEGGEKRLVFGIRPRRGTYKFTTEYWQFVEFGARHGFAVKGMFVGEGPPYTGQLFRPGPGAFYFMANPTPSRRYLKYTVEVFKASFNVRTSTPVQGLKAFAERLRWTVGVALDKAYSMLESRYSR